MTSAATSRILRYRRVDGSSYYLICIEPKCGEQAIARVDITTGTVLNPRAAGKRLQERYEQIGGNRLVSDRGVGRFRHGKTGTPVPQSTLMHFGSICFESHLNDSQTQV